MTRVILNPRTGPFVLLRDEIRADRVWICGCGLTSTPPYCDNSHATARKEAPGALVHYPDNDDQNEPIAIEPTQFARKPRAPPDRDAGSLP